MCTASMLRAARCGTPTSRGSQHYLDKKSRATVGLGHLLNSGNEGCSAAPPASSRSVGIGLEPPTDKAADL
jgi:hypothetical protein